MTGSSIGKVFRVTTWGESSIGDIFNVEIDLLARYLDRLQVSRN